MADSDQQPRSKTLNEVELRSNLGKQNGYALASEQYQRILERDPNGSLTERMDRLNSMSGALRRGVDRLEQTAQSNEQFGVAQSAYYSGLRSGITEFQEDKTLETKMVLSQDRGFGASR